MMFLLLLPHGVALAPTQMRIQDNAIFDPSRPGGPDNSEGIGEAPLAEIRDFFIGVFASAFLVFALAVLIVHKYGRRLSEYDHEREEENQAYMELDSDEQELFFQSKEFLSTNPYVRDEMTLSQNLLIQEKGIKAWEFVKDQMLSNNDLLIVNKTELNFFKKFECCTQTNLPIPMKNDVYYFESKIYSLPDADNTMISIGVGIKPYPWFRLPGRHAHSVSYDSTGYRRHNHPFKIDGTPPFPKLIEGDVVGVGYRVRSGTIFFTRNGKKVHELAIGGHIKNFKIPHGGQIFPIIGANNLCSVHVNLGQMGFVFIEGNVKKWGFAPLEGTGPAPPAYNKFNADILLERLEIDDDDLSERENDFPPDFWESQNNDKWSYNAYGDVNSTDERITLASLPNHPPSYDTSDGEELNAEELNANEEFPESNPDEGTPASSEVPEPGIADEQRSESGDLDTHE